MSAEVNKKARVSNESEGGMWDGWILRSNKVRLICFFFFLKWRPTPQLYTYCHTLSLHDALPIGPLKKKKCILSQTVCISSQKKKMRSHANISHSPEIGRAHVLNPVTRFQLAFRHLLEKKKTQSLFFLTTYSLISTLFYSVSPLSHPPPPMTPLPLSA